MVKDDLVLLAYGALAILRTGASRLSALIVVLLAVAAASAFFVLPRISREPPADPQQDPPAAAGEPALNPNNFAGWPKPDLAIVVTGQTFGYLQPCGCSEPQEGGLARRYNLIQLLKKRGWEVLATDVGDVAPAMGLQSLLKYRYAMKAMTAMEYTAIGIGENEASQPLFRALGELINEKNPPPVLAANLKDAKKNFPQMIHSIVVKNKLAGKIGAVGFTSVVAPSVAAKISIIDPTLKFDPVNVVLTEAIKKLQDHNADLLVLLLQGSNEEAKAVAAQFPQFQLIVCLDSSDVASAKADEAGATMIVSLGQKGKCAGVVGVKRTDNPNQPFELRYQLVAIDPSLETPKGKDADNPIHQILQDYADEVKRNDYLTQYHRAPHPLQVAYPKAEYVGSEACKACHREAYKIWEAHPHAHAYETLVKKAVRPTNRQYDPECVKCHTTGFEYKTGFIDEKQTPQLVNVGCESCHGPGSLHVEDKTDMKVRKAMNPLRTTGPRTPAEWTKLSDACMKCHDLENSVHFNVQKYWEELKTEHSSPKKVAQQAKK